MSLGTCALKASGETNAIAKGRHPWQPWNKLTTQTNVTLKKSLEITYLKGYLPWQPNAKEGGRRGYKNPH